MNLEKYLETMWVKRSQALAVKPEAVTIANQAKFNAVVKLIEVQRSTIKYAYMGWLLISFLLMKARIMKAPEFISSIPVAAPVSEPQPTAPPELKLVQSNGQEENT